MNKNQIYHNAINPIVAAQTNYIKSNVAWNPSANTISSLNLFNTAIVKVIFYPDINSPIDNYLDKYSRVWQELARR